MSYYTVTCNLLKRIEQQRIYVTKILYSFASENSFKIVLDHGGKIADLYEKIAKNDHIIYAWLDLMTKIPSRFETIQVEIEDSIDEEELFLKVCRHTKIQQKLIVFSHNDWKIFNYTYLNRISYDSIEIEVYDRDEAIIELNPPSGGDTYHVKESNFANRGGKIKKSDIK